VVDASTCLFAKGFFKGPLIKLQCHSALRFISSRGLIVVWLDCAQEAPSTAFAEHRHHLCDKGFALFHGSTAFLQRASRLALRSFSLMLKLSSRGAIGRVASRTSAERSELVDVAEDVDRVLRALERRRGCGFDERKSMLSCCLVVFGW
jgi:hypothetical protein